MPQLWEEVIITYQDKACAKLVPVEPQISPQDNVLFGIWQHHNPSSHVDDYLRALR